MKACIFFSLALLPFFAGAQRSIEGLIGAEKSFAAWSLAHGTKDAFLNFTDSLGLMFDKSRPVLARSFWQAREKRPGVLNWRPTYAEVAASGEFGYTTGPWTFQ